ncbi:acetate/propionate family kinase [Ralstonia mojiangensis]|uniref:acetate/propionate family kinase n=1 Tax=Ralstonia mojiangensis TaxID=2953895 RepID=UPI0021B4ABF0|nr:acetate/propionate family kinase [Ralstonia mojiangensis]MCT7326778.1 acetate/propionate family kinase [Ralstonia mojiangensis]
MNDCIVVLNCGSSSIKFAMFDATLRPLPRVPMWSGKVEGIGTDHPTATEAGTPTQALALDSAQPYHAALMHIRQRVEHRLDGRRLMAVAHRVVHGGSKYFAPVRVNADVLSDLRSYIPLAPLHQPFALEAIEALLSDLPDVPQIACFDTAFHRTLPQVEAMLPLPYTAWEHGLRRYGFHGLSYEYMSIALQERHGDIALGRTIVAHLGSGASLCAMQGLKSVATTMGFSALEGLMMGTRCGSLDPGAVLYMMETEHLSPTQVGHVLYHESGLLGVSGLSSDPRDIIAHEADNPRAQAALALYVRRIVREIGALVAVLGGLDFLVFTAGIGEHNAVLRERIVGGLGYLGANLDDEANQAHAAVISSSSSRIRVAVEPTNEEWVAARHAVKLCS